MSGELILVVEDEPRIAELLERGLHSVGYRSERAASGSRALELWRAARPALILLDLNIPTPDGLEVLRTVRRESDTPVIILSARAEEIDRLLGLELGADDYVLKPFSPREVLLRVRTVLRRAQASGPRQRPQVQVGELRIDLEAFEASCGGETLPLTRVHLELLLRLASRPGRAFSRAELLDNLGDGTLHERTVDTHIRNLRARLGNCGAQLETVRGVGYRLNAAQLSVPDEDS